MSRPDQPLKVMNIRAVAERSQVSVFALRIWEQRYNAFSPQRTASGRRCYGPDDVEKAVLLGRLVHSGHAIGRIAKLAIDDLRALVNDAVFAAKVAPTGDHAGESENWCAEVLELLESFELERINQALTSARLGLSAREFVLSRLSPLFASLGWMVARDDLSIAQEHALSAIVRTQIAHLLIGTGPASSRKPDDLPQGVALCTPSGNYHEFGILMAHVLCAARGIPVYYLGSNLPAQSLSDAANALRPAAVLIGYIPSGDDETAVLPDYLADLTHSLSNAIAIWVGGDTALGLPKTRHAMRHFPSLAALDEHLSLHKQALASV